MVIITYYKSADFYLKVYHIKYISRAKIKYCPIEFDIDSINEDTNYIYCTQIISPYPTDKDIIMYQLKPFKHYIH